MYALQHGVAIALASGSRDERQVQDTNLVAAKFSGQGTNRGVEFLDHVVHRVGEAFPGALLLHLELLGDDLLDLFALAVDPLQIRASRVIEAFQKRPVGRTRRAYHQSVRRIGASVQHRGCSQG
ncbi:hypothetical protein D3C80_1720700 [compost metagenome]